MRHLLRMNFRKFGQQMLILISKFFESFPIFLRILNQKIHFRAYLKTKIFDFPKLIQNFQTKRGQFLGKFTGNANFGFGSASFLAKFTIFIDLDQKQPTLTRISVK